MIEGAQFTSRKRIEVDMERRVLMLGRGVRRESKWDAAISSEWKIP